MKYALITVLVFALGTASAGEMRGKNREAYGVWVRGEKRYDPKEFSYKGVEISMHWAEVEPSDGAFDWKTLDDGLERAAKLGLHTCLGISVGPLSPKWLYEKGVPGVMTQGHKRSGPYPYYLDPRHLFYYHRMIEEFNGLMSWADPALRDWVRAKVNGGWAHKQPSGFCYQLNDEGERALEFIPHLIDPASDDCGFFTRCELDRGWEKNIFFKPNVRMSFYWTALSALHSGLNIWELTGGAREWCRDNQYWEYAHFFNRYAGQTCSPTAQGAFCALREGMDAADTEKFPESKFGKATCDNAQRYLAICAAYAARGAKMDCVEGVLKNQTNQRNTQDGLNDSGWAIFRGNYERFLHQIDPDQTSVGWWRVGGPVTESPPVYGRFARSFDHASGKDALYFDIKDSFFSGKPLAGAYPVTVRIVYYDQGAGQWSSNTMRQRTPRRPPVA